MEEELKKYCSKKKINKRCLEIVNNTEDKVHLTPYDLCFGCFYKKLEYKPELKECQKALMEDNTRFKTTSFFRVKK